QQRRRDRQPSKGSEVHQSRDLVVQGMQAARLGAWGQQLRWPDRDGIKAEAAQTPREERTGEDEQVFRIEEHDSVSHVPRPLRRYEPPNRLCQADQQKPVGDADDHDESWRDKVRKKGPEFSGFGLAVDEVAPASSI